MVRPKCHRQTVFKSFEQVLHYLLHYQLHTNPHIYAHTHAHTFQTYTLQIFSPPTRATMLFEKNAPTTQLTFRPWLLLWLSATTEYVVIRTSHSTTSEYLDIGTSCDIASFYADRMHLIEYVIFFFWGGGGGGWAVNLQRRHSAWPSHQEWSGNWNKVSPSHKNLLWEDQCVIHFLNESYVMVSLREIRLTCDPVWCDSLSVNVCIKYTYGLPIPP